MAVTIQIGRDRFAHSVSISILLQEVCDIGNNVSSIAHEFVVVDLEQLDMILLGDPDLQYLYFHLMRCRAVSVDRP